MKKIILSLLMITFVLPSMARKLTVLSVSGRPVVIENSVRKPIKPGEELTDDAVINIPYNSSMDLIDRQASKQYHIKTPGRNTLSEFLSNGKNGVSDVTKRYLDYVTEQVNGAAKRAQRAHSDAATITRQVATFTPKEEEKSSEEESLADKWKKDFDKQFILSINISAIQYKREDFVDGIIGIIDRYKMDPKELELEITETALIDNYDDVCGKLSSLRDYGIRISMDDFGTGYSSLSYLKSLPIDTLKIDRSFVETMLQDTNSNSIMESIMYMVQRLGLETVAEGVETKEQLMFLKEINCDNIQGFLLGKPQSCEDIEEMLKE